MAIVTRAKLKAGAKIAYEIVVGAVIAGIVIYAIVWFFILRHREADIERARNVVQEQATKATGEAAADSMNIVNETNRTITRIDEITRRNEDAINSASGADAPAPGVAGALRGALCMRTAYQSDPRCAAVPRDGGSERAAEPNAWGTPAAE